jgi:hypothetical protein
MGLELAKKHLEKNVEYHDRITFKGEYQVKKVSFETANEAIELAAKIDWKYPEKNELPEKDAKVYCVCFSGSMAGLNFSHYSIGRFNGRCFSCEMDWITVIAWCELPIFNKA